jgi:ABC-type Mn2+/Zn2+ transport system permease subunit
VSRARQWALAGAAGSVATLAGAAASLLFHGRAAFIAWVAVGSVMGVLLGIALGLHATRNTDTTTTGDPE